MDSKGFGLTKLLLLLSLLLSACSSEPDREDESNSQANQCSQEEIAGGAAWITGQLNAFGSDDPSAAYNFASAQFRQGVSLENFVALISGGILKYTLLVGWFVSLFYYAFADFMLVFFSFFVAFNNQDFVSFINSGITTIDSQWGIFYG